MEILYTDFDYLWDEPYYLNGVGFIKCPKLKEIRKITYQVFILYLNLISASKEEITLLLKSTESSKKSTEDNTIFSLLLNSNKDLLLSLIRFFISSEIVRFNTETLSFDIYDILDGQEFFAGNINASNFEDFRSFVSIVLGSKQPKKEMKFKSERARLLMEKIERERAKQAKTSNSDYVLDNMILKYCTHNKVGINMLNVGELTYYQFLKLFNEYSFGRQVDYNDMIAGNTFSYKDVKDYKSDKWIEKIKNTDC